MPDMWTHILCGNEALEALADSRYKALLQHYRKLFNFGTQGPDFLYYYHLWSLFKSAEARRYGSMLHRSKTSSFLLESVSFLKHYKKKGAAYLLVYLSGFMCHFALDRITHPYIYYRSGAYDREVPQTLKYNIYHKRLELIIDTLLLKEKRGVEACQTPADSEIDTGPYLPRIISLYYQYMFNRVYQEHIDISIIDQAYGDMKSQLKFITGTNKTKEYFIGFLDGMINPNLRLSQIAAYPSEMEDDKDYLNKQHSEWIHPCDDKEKSTLGFLDLYGQAVEESKAMIQGTFDYLAGKKSLEDLRPLFPNVSCLTGKPLDTNAPMKYFNCIFEKAKEA